MHTLIIAILVSAVFASPPPPAPSPARSPTKALIARDDLARLVDELAAMNRIESSHIGAAGSPSPVWAAWDEVRALATRAELGALLSHESAVVRGYVARHLVRSEALAGAYDGWLRDVLADTSSVESIDGCMISQQTLAEMALEDLCYNAFDRDGARAALTKAAADPALAHLHERIVQCLPKKR